jgi:hypothetical protein
MFVVLQFPFSDARRFISTGTNLLPVPAWPLANPDREFVRSFGQVRRRPRGGLVEWAGEDLYCATNRALRFVPALSRQRLGIMASSLEAVSVFQRFFSDGGAVSRMEFGFRVDMPDGATALDGVNCLELIEKCYAIKVLVPSANDLAQNCELLDCARLIGARYLAATTRKMNGKNAHTEPFWFIAREPVLLIEYHKGEITSLPKFSSVAMDLPEAGIQLHHCWVNRRGRLLPVWFLKELETATARNRWEAWRRLRINLFRLHAERECLRGILNLLAQKKIDVTPRTESSDELQSYLLESTRQLSRPSSYGFDQSKLLDAAQRFHDVVAPSDRPTLLSQLSKIRRNVLRNVTEFTRPNEKSAVSSVHVIASTVIIGKVERIGGDTMTNYNVTISGSNNTVGDIVVAEKIQNSFNKAEASTVSKEQKENLAKLHQQIVELSKELPPDKAQQVAGDLESFTNEVTSSSPRRKWYELSGGGLIEAAKTVATMAGPVTTTVKAILSLLTAAA